MKKTTVTRRGVAILISGILVSQYELLGNGNAFSLTSLELAGLQHSKITSNRSSCFNWSGR
jgi:hypothetical protein